MKFGCQTQNGGRSVVIYCLDNKLKIVYICNVAVEFGYQIDHTNKAIDLATVLWGRCGF